MVGAGDGGQRRRADAVADHAHGLGDRQRCAVGASVDDVAGREALGAVQLGRLEHAQADVGDDVGHAAHLDGDQKSTGSG